MIAKLEFDTYLLYRYVSNKTVTEDIYLNCIIQFKSELNSTYLDNSEPNKLLYYLRHLGKLLHRELERDCYTNVYDSLSHFHTFHYRQTKLPS